LVSGKKWELVSLKLKISSNIKITLVCVISILTLSTILSLYKTIKYPTVKEQKNILYNYQYYGLIDYKVILKPSILYGDNTILSEGNVYISELVDATKINFKYNFEGERPADIKGDYEISAVVEGFTGNEKEQKIIWRKVFPIQKKEAFESRDKVIAFEKEVLISYQEYEKFARTVLESTKVSSQVRMTVAMNVNLKATTDKGVIEKRISPSIKIPLISNYFEITKNQTQPKTEAIEETIKVTVPASKITIAIYISVILILIVALFFLIFFAKVEAVYNPMEKELKKIIKNYGERMIAFDDHISFNCQNYYKVCSFEDLIKLSDEISKPIMYKYNSDISEIYEFFVFDNQSIYTFDARLKISEYAPRLMNAENSIEA
jgi:preprotein translocase subunit SecE